jgi:8-oxo-dGTP pyrophosphatase MutT (NUDIX family)
MKHPCPHSAPAPSSWDPDCDPSASAVLALFLDDPSLGRSLLFTRRAAMLRSHAGQVGFPGGRREVYDESPVATALREASEEIGLNADDVTVLGALTALKSLDGKPVLPILASARISISDLVPSPDEVAEIFLVPCRELTPNKRRVLRFNIFGTWRETPYYEALGHHVWGLTAWMIDRLAITDAL